MNGGGALEEALDRWRLDAGMRGVTAKVVCPGSLEWGGAAGTLGTLPDRPMRVDQPGRVGSITKAFTGALVLRLVEEGSFSLDDTLDTFVPACAGGHTVKIRHLLSHHSGLQELQTDDLVFVAATCLRLFHWWTIDEIIAWSRSPWPMYSITAGKWKGRGLQFEPGTDFLYSQPNYFLLAKVVEVVTGESFETNLRERILEPLGLDSTVYVTRDRNPRLSGRTNAMGFFRRVMPTWLIPTYNSVASAGGPAGGLISTVDDLAAFLRSLLGEGFLSSASLAEMLTFLPAPSFGPAHEYGLGVNREKIGDITVIGQSGGIPGFQGRMRYVPDRDIYVTILANTDPRPGAATLDDLIVRFVEILDESARGITSVRPPHVGSSATHLQATRPQNWP